MNSAQILKISVFVFFTKVYRLLEVDAGFNDLLTRITFVHTHFFESICC